MRTVNIIVSGMLKIPTGSASEGLLKIVNYQCNKEKGRAIADPALLSLSS